MIKPLNIFLLSLIITGSTAYSQNISPTDSIADSIDCIVLKNKFIVKGKIIKWQQGGLLTKKKAVIMTHDGTEWDYPIGNISYIRYNGLIVRPLSLKPGSKKSRNTAFMIRIMHNNEYSIYKYEHILQTEYGPVYDWRYFLYKNDEFLKKVKKKNYRQILEDYFNTCPYIREIVTSKKNHFWDDKFSKIAHKYRTLCK